MSYWNLILIVIYSFSVFLQFLGYCIDTFSSSSGRFCATVGMQLSKLWRWELDLLACIRRMWSVQRRSFGSPQIGWSLVQRKFEWEIWCIFGDILRIECGGLRPSWSDSRISQIKCAGFLLFEFARCEDRLSWEWIQKSTIISFLSVQSSGDRSWGIRSTSELETHFDYR